MKRMMSIAAVALFLAGSSVWACETCGCKAKKADGKKATCEQKSGSCTAEKGKAACDAKKGEKKCGEDCKKECCAKEAKAE